MKELRQRETTVSRRRSSVTRASETAGLARYKLLTSAMSFVIESFASPNSITVFGL